MGSTLKGDKKFQFDILVSDPDTANPQAAITKIDIVKDGGVVVQAHTPSAGHTIHWMPVIEDATAKYFFVRLWTAGRRRIDGSRSGEADGLAGPVWTGR
jgi:hypothetical protein